MKRHFDRRFKSSDGHLFFTEDGGRGTGYLQSLVGYLAEISRPGSLEFVEELLQDTITTVTDAPYSGRVVESRQIPNDPIAVQATVARANEWVRQVQAGRTAGASARKVAEAEAVGMARSASLVSAGLIVLAPQEVVEGLLLAVRPRPLQSQKIKDLNFAVQIAMRNVRGLADLMRDV